MVVNQRRRLSMERRKSGLKLLQNFFKISSTLAKDAVTRARLSTKGKEQSQFYNSGRHGRNAWKRIREGVCVYVRSQS